MSVDVIVNLLNELNKIIILNLHECNILVTTNPKYERFTVKNVIFIVLSLHLEKNWRPLYFLVIARKH
jgi:hypothetical protein